MTEPGRGMESQGVESPLAECVARAMDGPDSAIVPFLPYILQDAWEIGTDPQTVIDLVRRHRRGGPDLKILDLGCGKGAVAVRLAHEFGCRCLGVDALPEFIAFAEAKAGEFGVEDLCRFETGDIRQRLASLGGFDVVVLGAIGPVFGDYRETLTALKPHLRPGGLVVVDDGYLEDDSLHILPRLLRREELLRQVARVGMELLGEVRFAAGWLAEENARIYADLTRRCRELIEQHPERRELFEGYIRRQGEENETIETRLVCAVMVFRRRGRGRRDRRS